MSAMIIKAPSSSGTEYTVTNPLWGYKVSVVMALKLSRRTGAAPVIWDDTNTYDFRMLEATWFLSLAQTTLLLNLAKDAGKGRDANVDLILTSGGGFYPFGPDKGDAGTFRARIMDIQAEATIGHPQDYFKTTLKLLFNGSYPSYSPLPDLFPEGVLQIGNVTGLRWPDDYHKQNQKYAMNVNQGGDGTPYANDRSSAADFYESDLSLILNHPNAAGLLNEMVTTRGADINVIPPANSYLFGLENGSTATYVCKSTKKQIDIVHNGHNNFGMDLSFYRISG